MNIFIISGICFVNDRVANRSDALVHPWVPLAWPQTVAPIRQHQFQQMDQQP